MKDALRVAVMQPYFLPYAGYWQLMQSADVFVLYDDVQYSSGSWINRNRIRSASGWQWITVPVARSPISTRIREVRLSRNHDAAWARVRRRVDAQYANEEWSERGVTILEGAHSEDHSLLMELVGASIRLTNTDLGIRTPVLRASTIDYDREAPREERLIDLCRACGATEYLSLSGGRALYSPDRFAASTIALRFHDLTHLQRVAHGAFDPALSIIDAIMTAPPEVVRGVVTDSRWVT